VAGNPPTYLNQAVWYGRASCALLSRSGPAAGGPAPKQPKRTGGRRYFISNIMNGQHLRSFSMNRATSSSTLTSNRNYPAYRPAALCPAGELHLKEIKTLFYGFDAETPLSARWRSLARKKVCELDELAERVLRMREALELSLNCDCMRLEDCSLSPADVSPPRRQHAHGRSKGAC
jgi:hypothetical protein